MSGDPLPTDATNGVLRHMDEVQEEACSGFPSLRRLATLIIDAVDSLLVVATPEADRK